MPCTSFQFFKKNIEDCCAKLKNHTYKVGRESSTKVYLRHQYLRGTHNNKEWLAEEEKKTRGPSTDVKGRKHIKEWRAVRVRDKNTQAVLNSSDTVVQAHAMLGRKREDWKVHILVNPKSPFF